VTDIIDQDNPIERLYHLGKTILREPTEGASLDRFRQLKLSLSDAVRACYRTPPADNITFGDLKTILRPVEKAGWDFCDQPTSLQNFLAFAKCLDFDITELRWAVKGKHSDSAEGKSWTASGEQVTGMGERGEPAADEKAKVTGAPQDQGGMGQPENRTAEQQPASPPPPADVEPQKGKESQFPAPKIDLEAQALALLFQQRNWSLAQIADHLGVNRKTLYKWPKFREAAELRGLLKPRGSKAGSPPRGHKTRERMIEAYAEEEEVA
jgi:hypothetical protein